MPLLNARQCSNGIRNVHERAAAFIFAGPIFTTQGKNYVGSAFPLRRRNGSHCLRRCRIASGSFGGAAFGADPGAWIQLRRQALDLFQRDYGYRKVASLLGISVYTVREWARAYRKGEFTAEPSRRFYSTEEQVRIAAMSKSGMQPAEIARLLQIPVRSVRSILARNRREAGAAD